jgi:hypothetical protein
MELAEEHVNEHYSFAAKSSHSTATRSDNHTTCVQANVFNVVMLFTAAEHHVRHQDASIG